MSYDDADNAPFGDSPDNSNPETEKFQKQIAAIYKKLSGEDSTPVTNNEILQFLRIINFNFLTLTKWLQTILLKTVEIDTALMNLELTTTRMDKHLQQFFDANSALDEIMEGTSSVSGSTSTNKFIL